jgi:uncharacterized phage protein (TIGR02220 family)
MKHNILGFCQKSVMEFEIVRTEKRKGVIKTTTAKLDMEHLTILRYFIDFRGTDRMVSVTVDGQSFYWLKYQHLLDDLPILNISKERLADKLKDLVTLKILKRLILKEAGIFSYYNIDENYARLINTDLSAKTPIAIGVNTHTPIGVNTQTNNPSTKEDPSTKHTNKKVNQKKDFLSVSVIDELIGYYNEKTGRAFKGYKQLRTNIATVLKDYTADDCKHVIDYITRDEWHVSTRNHTLSVIFRPTKFGEKLEKANIFVTPKQPKPKCCGHELSTGTNRNPTEGDRWEGYYKEWLWCKTCKSVYERDSDYVPGLKGQETVGEFVGHMVGAAW